MENTMMSASCPQSMKDDDMHITVSCQAPLAKLGEGFENYIDDRTPILRRVDCTIRFVELMFSQSDRNSVDERYMCVLTAYSPGSEKDIVSTGYGRDVKSAFDVSLQAAKNNARKSRDCVRDCARDRRRKAKNAMQESCVC